MRYPKKTTIRIFLNDIWKLLQLFYFGFRVVWIPLQICSQSENFPYPLSLDKGGFCKIIFNPDFGILQAGPDFIEESVLPVNPVPGIRLFMNVYFIV